MDNSLISTRDRQIINKLAGNPCPDCDGCGYVANSEGKELWTTWLGLPLGSAMAVVAGLVRPVKCDTCKGIGKGKG